MSKDKRQLAQELQDDRLQSAKCETHHYIGNLRKPPVVQGCPACCKAWLFTLFQGVPPSERQQVLEQLYAAVSHAVEDHEKGRFDFRVIQGAIKVERNAC